MTYLTTFTIPKNYNPLSVGDIIVVKETGKELRYTGIHHSPAINPPYDKGLLEFTNFSPVHPINQINNNGYEYFYLATKDSSTKGLIELPVKGLESISFLNEFVSCLSRDIIVIGNITQESWRELEQASPIK